jgi:hypothetical protein
MGRSGVRNRANRKLDYVLFMVYVKFYFVYTAILGGKDARIWSKSRRFKKVAKEVT